MLTIGHVWPGYTYPVVLTLTYRAYLVLRAAAELWDRDKRERARA